MKRQKINSLNIRSAAFIFSVILLVMMILSNESMAQRRGGPGRGRVRVNVHITPRPGFIRGHFHAPAIGTHIRILPAGYVSFWLGGLEYYYYDGIYYRYLPSDEVYVIIDKPKGAEKVTNLKFDQVILNDGSVVEGEFIGGTGTTVIIKVGDKEHEININDVKSIQFAPAAPAPDKK